MDKNLKISIAVPTYEMDATKFFTRRLLDSLTNQTYKNFDVIISDNSQSDVIKEICSEYKDLNIKYLKSDKVGMAQNTNEAIKRSHGDIVKILYQDDYLAHKDSLKLIVEAFKGGWLVSGCIHDDELMCYNPHYPTYNNRIHTGNNTIGSPSVLAFENNDPLLFDENLGWLLDCDLYRRLYERYGEPTILNDLNIAIGIGEHQSTHIMGNEIKLQEHQYMNNKYD